MKPLRLNTDGDKNEEEEEEEEEKEEEEERKRRRRRRHGKRREEEKKRKKEKKRKRRDVKEKEESKEEEEEKKKKKKKKKKEKKKAEEEEEEEEEEREEHNQFHYRRDDEAENRKMKEDGENEEKVVVKTYDLAAWRNEIAKLKSSRSSSKQHVQQRQRSERRKKSDGENDEDDVEDIFDTSGRTNTTGAHKNNDNKSKHNEWLLLRIPLWARKSALAQRAVAKAFKSRATIKISDSEKISNGGTFRVSAPSAEPLETAVKVSSFEQALRANRVTQERVKEVLKNINAVIERDAVKIEEIKELWQSQQHQQKRQLHAEEKEEKDKGAKEGQKFNFARRRRRKRNDDCDEELEAVANDVGKIFRRKMDTDNKKWLSSSSLPAYFKVVGISSELANEINDTLPPKAFLLDENSDKGESNGNSHTDDPVSDLQNVSKSRISSHSNDASRNSFKPWSREDDFALIEGVRLYLLEKRRLRKQVDLEELAGEKKIPVEDILTENSKGWQGVWENCSLSTSTLTSIDDWAVVRKLCPFTKTFDGNSNNKEVGEDDGNNEDHDKPMLVSRTPDDLRLRWMHEVDPRIASTIASSSSATPWTKEEDAFLASLVQQDSLEEEEEEEEDFFLEKRKWFRVAKSLNAHTKQSLSSRRPTQSGDDIDSEKKEEHGREAKEKRRGLLLRSPFQCLHRYQTILNRNLTRSRWTSKDDYALQTFVQECGEGRWNECARFLPEHGHTAMQCKNRYSKLMEYHSEENFKKGKWTKEEDEELRAIILGAQKQGEKQEEDMEEEENKEEKNKRIDVEFKSIPWSLIAKKMSTNRRDRDCRVRWTNILQPSLLNEHFFGISSGTNKKFTPKEDAMLLVLHANCTDKKEFKWSDFGSAPIMPGKSQKQCQQRLYTLLKRREEVEIRERLEREIIEKSKEGSDLQQRLFLGMQ